MTRPEQPPRTPAQRAADHAAIAELSDALLPALVARLATSGLGELEVREGDWKIRLRRPPQAATGTRRSGRHGAATAASPERPSRDTAVVPAVIRSDGPPDPAERRSLATSPAVGVFRPVVAVGSRVRAGDRVAVVDMLGIPQDVAAPIDGTLVEVFVEAGEAVEYGEDVAAVEPDPAPGEA
jgi:acetyl-CoA carboxylase biotin carboxyl carrier protein